MKQSILLFSLIMSTIAFADFDETQIQAPIFESNEEILYGTSCRSREFWDICFSVTPQNKRTMRSFKFKNRGINPIVPSEGFSIGRDFEFNFEGLARSDMNLLIWDSPDEIESHAHLKVMYFFPREVMPAIRIDESLGFKTLIVTLPTREEVVFSEKTHEVISGVLIESPMRQTTTGHAVAPGIQYSGRGVVVEASALADWPVGFEGDRVSKTVLIKKYGLKACVVPGKELFYTDHSKGGNVFFNKKYLTDSVFDSYVQKRCGFSIY